jgi:hypothetical protein
MTTQTPGASAPSSSFGSSTDRPPSKAEIFIDRSITINFLEALAQIIAFGTDGHTVELSSHQLFCLFRGLITILEKDAEASL